MGLGDCAPKYPQMAIIRSFAKAQTCWISRTLLPRLDIGEFHFRNTHSRKMSMATSSATAGSPNDQKSMGWKIFMIPIHPHTCGWESGRCFPPTATHWAGVKFGENGKSWQLRMQSGEKVSEGRKGTINRA